MNLIDLHPEWRENPPGNRYLSLDCPTCPAGTCRITIPVDNKEFPENTWTMELGPAFETLRISPSLQHHCATSPHFWIRNGEIVMA
jgi:hypothetical protein